MNVKWKKRFPRVLLFTVLSMGLAYLLVLGVLLVCSLRDRRPNECKYNLQAWHDAERAYFRGKNAYVLNLRQLGFMIERGNRYAYITGPGPLLDRNHPEELMDRAEGFELDQGHYTEMDITYAQLPPEVGRQMGLSGVCPQCEVAMACAAQLDKDATLDVWSISTGPRTMADGTFVSGGALFHHVED